MDFYRAALQINPDLESAQSQLQAVETKVELLALRVGAAQNGSSLLSVDCKSGHCCLFFFLYDFLHCAAFTQRCNWWYPVW